MVWTVLNWIKGWKRQWSLQLLLFIKNVIKRLTYMSSQKCHINQKNGTMSRRQMGVLKPAFMQVMCYKMTLLFSWHNVWHVALILNLYKRNGAPCTPLFLLCGSIFTAGAPWASSILSFLHLPYTNKSKTNPNPLGCPVARLVSTLCIQYLHVHVCRFLQKEENFYFYRRRKLGMKSLQSGWISSSDYYTKTEEQQLMLKLTGVL